MTVSRMLKRIVFVGWMAVVFMLVRTCLSFPLRSQWGTGQVTAAQMANLSSVVAVAGIFLPVFYAKTASSGGSVFRAMLPLRKYFLFAHLWLIVMTWLIADGISRSLSIDTEGVILLGFILLCHLTFFLTVKND